MRRINTDFKKNKVNPSPIRRIRLIRVLSTIRDLINSMETHTVSRSMLTTIARQQIHWVFFLALTLFYFSLAPGTVEGIGYMQENILASSQLVTNLINLVTMQHVTPVDATRHGLLEPIFGMPNAFLSKTLFGSSLKWLGRLMVFQSIITTALLCTVIFIWVRIITSNLGWAYLLALIAGLSTMIWPYAYIGLETTQSLFLLLAGYLALEQKPTSNWREVILLAFTCAVAISVKQNGVFLLPAVVYLLFRYFRSAAFKAIGLWQINIGKLLVAIIMIASVWFLNMRARSPAWAATPGGDVGYAVSLMVNDPLLSLLQAFSYFGSPNKSLLIYAPVTALGLLSIRQAYRYRPEIAVFALLTLFGLVGGFSLVYMWSEETWGPRYLHASIAPLIICFAVARAGNRIMWRKELPLVVAAILGFLISFLGSLFFYGYLHVAATRSSHSTLESLQYDPRLNHLRFNLKLLEIWGRTQLGDVDPAIYWPPPYHWWFQKPPDLPSEKTLSLCEFAVPQPMLFRPWKPSLNVPQSIYHFLRVCCLFSLVLSLSLFIWLRRLARFEAPDSKSNV